MGDQSFFKGALGWDDWIWWSVIGAVGLFLLMLLLCCCVCIRRAKRNGRREAIAQANVRRREREQQQHAEQQYAQARQAQLAQQREASFKYSKPEPPAQAQAFAQGPPNNNQYGYQQQQPQYQQQQQQPPYRQPQPSLQQYPPQPSYNQQYQPQAQAPYTQPYNQQYAAPPQQYSQPKYYPPPASPPPARYDDPTATPAAPPLRQMYEGVESTANRYHARPSDRDRDATERSGSSAPLPTAASPARRYQNRSLTQTNPDAPPLLQYGRISGRQNSTELSTQDTFGVADPTLVEPDRDDVPFLTITSPLGGRGGNANSGFQPPRESNSSLPSRPSTQSKASSGSRGRGPTLQDRIEALRTGGVQDNHTRISLEASQPGSSMMAVASSATSSTSSPSVEKEKEKEKESVFQQQLAASAASNMDDSFVSGSSAFSFASSDSEDLTPREQGGSLDRRESVEF